ncbi:hypothetical protein C7212DRAFT_215497 [Tuber magnatum]|uniref:MARVEL domain-containing protein n=1 Tax=Tuber magnatum TaxID=42249 RepID=A0A317SI05_9PEZI|nr:hypothetical protein C7212DRAFT_215497 [Tuber magnatum]
MVQKNKSHRTPLPDPAIITIPRLVTRILQILIALAASGIYGRDLQFATKNDQRADSRWVFAEVVVGISILLAIAYVLPFVRSFKTFYLDGVVFLLWVVLLGIFGVLFAKVDCRGAAGCRRMKGGVWVDVVGMLLWFATFVGGGIMLWKDRHGKSIYTGRGSVA